MTIKEQKWTTIKTALLLCYHYNIMLQWSLMKIGWKQIIQTLYEIYNANHYKSFQLAVQRILLLFEFYYRSLISRNFYIQL